MIARNDILSLSYLKKAAYTGGDRGMRYCLEKKTGEEEETEELLVTVWPGPYGYDATPEEKKRTETFAFSEEGIESAIGWMNGIVRKVNG